MSSIKLDTHYDEVSGIIRLVSAGVWPIEAMRPHLKRLEELFARSRAQHGCVRVISDVREAGVQTQEVSALIDDFGTRCHRPDDRVAIIVSSSLLKMQMRRVSRNHVTEFFLSPSAAETWISASDHSAMRTSA